MNPRAESSASASTAQSASLRLLDQISSPDDVKGLCVEQLPQLAQEIREELIHVTAKNGGHVGPNLGVVELTIALHRVFSTPRDKFVFDVAHQGYIHKLLTGRQGDFFRKIRQTGGASGFLARDESAHDSFGAGHAGTALSAALGMASARDLKGTDEHVVALCGDAAFTCGITLEALNNVVASTRRLVVILNDNEWSIAKNVGAIAKSLNRLSTNRTYNKLHNDIEKFFLGLPGGPNMNRLWHKWKRETKDFFVESSLFEKFGLRYIGPIDGHNLDDLIKNLEFARDTDTPILLHVITEKGRGLDAARAHPEKFHGLGAFDPTTGEAKGGGPGTPPNYQDVFGKELVRLATTDKRIVGITAAMPSGTGLNHLATALPSQFFDVGIAEEHAALFAAGLATQGLKPVVAIYSTFLQRAYDPIIHDVALQRLPVVFCMDRAGLSPNDGATHHGLFDIAYLRPVPHALIMAPANEHDLADMMATALAYDGPAFIRYPRGACTSQPAKSARGLLPLGRAETVRPGTDIVIWAIGTMVADALVLADSLATEDGLDVGVVNARFVKPLDRELLLRNAGKARLIVTLEDHVATGGFGTAVLEALSDAGLSVPLERFGWPDVFIGHGSSQASLREAHGLSPSNMLARVRQRLTAITKSAAEPAHHPQPLAIEV